MDGEAGWWTTSGNIGLPPLARAMGVGRQQQQRPADGHCIYIYKGKEENGQACCPWLDHETYDGVIEDNWYSKGEHSVSYSDVFEHDTALENK